MIASLLFLGGCQVETYPEVPAFEDEFTREFLPSTEEVEEGYYLLKSKTGGYQMLFPENAKVSTFGYERNGEVFESLIFEEYNADRNIYIEHQLIYDFHSKEDYDLDLDVRLEALSTTLQHVGDYQTIEMENKDIYYANLTQDYGEEDNPTTVYRTFAYIVSKYEQFGIKYIITTTCYEFSNDCTINSKEQELNAFKMMKSIKFK